MLARAIHVLGQEYVKKKGMIAEKRTLYSRNPKVKRNNNDNEFNNNDNELK